MVEGERMVAGITTRVGVIPRDEMTTETTTEIIPGVPRRIVLALGITERRPQNLKLSKVLQQ